MKSLLVLGGSGYIGKSLCKNALSKNWKVYSVSRSGIPSGHESWIKDVNWIQGDALNVESYKQALPNVSAIVHSIGILFENSSYKKILNQGSANVTNTFEQMNRDTALNVIHRLQEFPNIKQFGFISAADVFPRFLVDPRYISTKRQVEMELLSIANLKSIIFRPGLIYSETRPITVTLASANKLATFLKSSLNLPFLDKINMVEPIRLDVLSSAMIYALESQNSGIFDVNGIFELASASH